MIPILSNTLSAKQFCKHNLVTALPYTSLTGGNPYRTHTGNLLGLIFSFFSRITSSLAIIYWSIPPVSFLINAVNKLMVWSFSVGVRY